MLSSEASPDITYQYDALNRLTNMVDAAGTSAFTYYAGGLLASEDGPWANDTVSYTYNTARLRSGLTLQQPTGSWSQSYDYDAAHRLTNVVSAAGAFDYTYDPARPRLVSRLDYPGGAYDARAYDSAARLQYTYLHNASDAAVNLHYYLYNAGGQRTRQYHYQYFQGAYNYTDYTYDPIGQLVRADSTVNPEDRGYLYDAAFNLNKRTNYLTAYTFTVDSKNQLISDPNYTDTYDASGNLTGQIYPGNVDPDHIYRYDDENQLTSVEYWSAGVPQWRTDFAYDGRERLRRRQDFSWSEGEGWVQNSETRYLCDGMRVIQERNNVNTPTVSYTLSNDLSGTLEGAGGIGGLLARSAGYSSGTWTSHAFYQADGNGNITCLMDGNQTVVAAYKYDPYGNVLSSSGTLASANLFRFSSKMIHVNSGLYYYGYRFYDPNLQRWLNRDPIGEFGHQLIRERRRIHLDDENLFTFVHNVPVSRIDPLGLSDRAELKQKLREIFEAIKQELDTAKTCQDIIKEIKDAVKNGEPRPAGPKDTIGGVLGVGGIPAGMISALEAFTTSSDCQQVMNCCKTQDPVGCAQHTFDCALDMANAIANDTSTAVGGVSAIYIEDLLDKNICRPKK